MKNIYGNAEENLTTGAKHQSEKMYSLDQISKDFIGEDGSGGYFDDYLDFRTSTKEKLTFKEWFNQNKK